MSGQPSFEDALTLFGQGFLGVIDEIVDLWTLLGQTVHLLNRDVLFTCNLPEELPGIDPHKIELQRQSAGQGCGTCTRRAAYGYYHLQLMLPILRALRTICDTGKEQRKYQ